MTRVIKSIGSPVMLSRVRRQRCVTTGCEGKTRLALTFPLTDIGEDGGPGLGAIVQCPSCIEEVIVRLTDAERRS